MTECSTYDPLGGNESRAAKAEGRGSARNAPKVTQHAEDRIQRRGRGWSLLQLVLEINLLGASQGVIRQTLAELN